MQFIKPELKDNPAMFPDEQEMQEARAAEGPARKERRLRNRLWTEIKVSE